MTNVIEPAQRLARALRRYEQRHGSITVFDADGQQVIEALDALEMVLEEVRKS